MNNNSFDSNSKTLTSDSTKDSELTREDDTELVFERVLLSIKECFIYSIPPLRSTAGFRAEEWDLAKPLLTGFLRIFHNDKSSVRIVLYSYKDPTSRSTADENLQVFGECPIEIVPKQSINAYIDEVIDSSRYFVLKIKDPKSNRTMRLGIGFTERDTAFDFRNSLNECIRYVDRMMTAQSLTQASESGDVTVTESTLLTRDLTIKEGEKIKIETKGLRILMKENNEKSRSSLSPDKDHKFVLRAPPKSTVITATSDEHAPIENSRDNKIDGEDDEWSDFSDATANQ